MVKSLKSDKLRKALAYTLGTLFLLVIWQIVALLAGNPLILPSPPQAMQEIARLIPSKAFYVQLINTIGRGLAGFAVSFLLAVMIGIISVQFRVAEYLFTPLLTAVRSTPVVSFILLALIWFGSDWVPVFIAILTMLPLICFGVMDGLHNTDNNLIEMAVSYRVSRWKMIRNIYIPSMLPFLFHGISNAMGFGWRAVIIGEVLSQPLHGIGSRLRDAQNYLNVSGLIAWTLVAILVSFLFETFVRQLERHWLRWKFYSRT